MATAFVPMSERERAEFTEYYLSYLRDRDGVPCLATRTLSRRETVVRNNVARAERRRWVDPVVFERNLDRCAPEPGLDPVTLWALAIAKANRAEKYGVEHKLDLRGFETDCADDPLVYVELQECYHSRMLVGVLEIVGLHCEVRPPVGALTRMGVRLFGYLPRVLLEILALAFELVAIAGFRALRDEARELFADQPQGAAIDALLTQLLVDEVGHVHFLRSRLGPRRLAMARALIPFAKNALFDDNEEARLVLERRGFPDLEHMDIDAMVAGEPGRVELPSAA